MKLKISILVLAALVLIPQTSFAQTSGNATVPDPTAEIDTAPDDITSPAQVGSFKALAFDGQVSLSWVNPADADYVRTIIVKKEGSTAPASITGGASVYEGTGTSFVDIGLTNGTTYSYSAFAFDAVPNYSAAASVTATPDKEKKQGTTKTTSSTPPSNQNSVINPVLNIPTPNAGTFKTGSLVNENGTIYLITGQIKVPFTSLSAFRGLGYQIKNVVKGDLSGYQAAQAYTISSAKQSHPWGSWLKRGKAIYYSHESGMIPVPSMAIFAANGGGLKFVLNMNAEDLKILKANPNVPMLTENDPRLYR